MPSAAASSTARRLSSSASSAAKNPPRHSEETFRPAASIRLRASSTPISATLCRHGPIHSMPCSAHASMTSASGQRSAVIELNERRALN